VAQVVEHLPCKGEALSSNPGTPKKKKKRKFTVDAVLGSEDTKSNSHGSIKILSEKVRYTM
jgi:hypothetical protein